MPEVISSLNSSVFTRNITKIAAFLALSINMLYYFGVSIIMLAIMLFAILSLSVYIQSLNHQIIQLKTQFSQFSAVKADHEKTSPEKKESYQQTLDTNFETQASYQEIHDYSKDIGESLGSIEESKLSLRIKQLEEALSKKDELIKKLQDSLERLAQRLDHSDTLIEDFSQIREKFVTKEEIEAKFTEINNKLGSLQILKGNVSNLQAVCQNLVDACNGEAEIQKRREDMEMKLVPLIRQFEEKLAQVFGEIPDLNEVEQRIFRVESKVELLPNIISMIEKIDQRLLKNEDKIKELATFIVQISESLNNRINELEKVLQGIKDTSKTPTFSNL